jgi:hypothetical protein
MFKLFNRRQLSDHLHAFRARRAHWVEQGLSHEQAGDAAHQEFLGRGFGRMVIGETWGWFPIEPR